MLKFCGADRSAHLPSIFLESLTEYLPGITSGPTAPKSHGKISSPSRDSGPNSAGGYRKFQATRFMPDEFAAGTRRMMFPEASVTVSQSDGASASASFRSSSPVGYFNAG